MIPSAEVNIRPHPGLSTKLGGGLVNIFERKVGYELGGLGHAAYKYLGGVAMMLIFRLLSFP